MKTRSTIPPESELRSLLKLAEAGSVPETKLPWLASLIDHTLLKKEATPEQLKNLCAEAKKFSFYAVCVHAEHVAICRELLKGSGVKIVTVTGFPVGDDRTSEKIAVAEMAIKAGADEVDMVMQVGALKERKLRSVYVDMRKVVMACGKIPVKVILETSLLSAEEILMASAIAKAAGAKFLKTSTGFSSGGATEESVKLLRSVARSGMGVKASGGVRTLDVALKMVLAGANRIGTSSGVNLVSGKSPKAGQSGVY